MNSEGHKLRRRMTGVCSAGIFVFIADYGHSDPTRFSALDVERAVHIRKHWIGPR